MKVEADTKRVCVLLFDGGGVVCYQHTVPLYFWREKFKLNLCLKCQFFKEMYDVVQLDFWKWKKIGWSTINTPKKINAKIVCSLLDNAYAFSKYFTSFFGVDFFLIFCGLP